MWMESVFQNTCLVIMSGLPSSVVFFCFPRVTIFFGKVGKFWGLLRNRNVQNSSFVILSCENTLPRWFSKNSVKSTWSSKISQFCYSNKNLNLYLMSSSFFPTNNPGRWSLINREDITFSSIEENRF